MFKLFVVAALLAYVVAAPQYDVELRKLESQLNTDGSYSYTQERSDGTSIAESGIGGDHATGYYSYTSPEGVPVQVSYVADENGFQPQSDLLPTPHPIPDYIQAALELIRTNPTPEELADREVRARQL